MDCLFCKIATGEIKSEIVYSDDEIIGFKDINPQAPVHILFIPKQHIGKISDIEEKDINLVSKLILKIVEYANKNGIKEYRLVINCGGQAGQSIFHLHIHLLSGRPMRWPPG